MAISVHRERLGYPLLRRLKVRLDGQAVAWIGSGETVRLAGTGAQQWLSVSVDWVTSNEVMVIDPGPHASIEFNVSSRHSLGASSLRSLVSPRSVLKIEAAGQDLSDSR